MSNTNASNVEPLSDHDKLPSRIKQIFCNAAHQYLASNYRGQTADKLQQDIEDHAKELCRQTYGRDHPQAVNEWGE
jgi:hypothetical protein